MHSARARPEQEPAGPVRRPPDSRDPVADPPRPLHPQLDRIVTAFEAAQARLHTLAGALPEERWNQRADPERWSVAECVAHLNLTGEAYLPVMRDALERARDLDAPPPRRYRRDPVGWLLCVATGPMARIGRLRLGAVRTPDAFAPERELPRDRVMAEFDRLQEEQIALVRDSAGQPIHRVKIRSPFGPKLRYSLYSALRMLPEHQARHAAQAERVWAADSG